MAHENRNQLYSDWKDTVHCSFKNVFTRNVAQIVGKNIHKILQIDHFKTNEMAQQAPSPFEFTCSREEANKIRDQLSDITTDSHSHVWFSMQKDPFHFLGYRRSMIGTVPPKISDYPVYFHFGSMYSYDTFNGHSEQHPSLHEISITRWRREEPETLRIMSKDKYRQIFIPIKWIQKQILVNTKGRPFVVFMLKYSVKMKRRCSKDNPSKYERLCKIDRENDLESVVSKSSDILLSFANEDHTYVFLNDLMQEFEGYRNKFVVNFVTLKHVQRDSNPQQNLTLPSSATHKQHYALKMLYSMGYIFQDKYGREIHDQFVSYDKNLFNELCYYLKEQLEENHCYKLKRIFTDFNEVLQKRQQEKDPVSENKFPYTIGLISLTPLRIIYQQMCSSIGNRALRLAQFGGEDNFLLVHIREEDNQPLKDFDPLIKLRLKSKMIDGIELLGKTYRLFGTSTSQLKEMSFWFVNIQNRSIEDAWKDLGEFGSIKNAATYVARIGLFFSTAHETNLSFRYVEKILPGMKFVVTKIDDIETNDKKYKFTDGIGKLSWGLAVLIAKRLKIPLESKEDVPSAYQVRVAGCKGMLAIDFESTFDDFYIKVRPSMDKFYSKHWDLEICEYSRPLDLKFNNQVIMLLSDLGNSKAVFEAYQNACFNYSTEPNENERNRKIKYVSSEENLLRNKIPLPIDEARNMFGIADETGTLEYGQVFIQYKNLDPNPDQKYIVVKGDVIVAKNPCLHPGDVRKFKAVDVPQLRSCIRDCIVFPVKGSRPHPNEMSGSDLDGDQYWVYWGHSLKIRQMDDPLTYDAAPPKKVLAITYDTVIDHIVNTFGTGSQGIICDIHLAIADSHKDRTRSEECRYLAELFARAVDAPKTGETIDLEKVYELRAKNIRGYPYFMKKYDQPLRESNSILNILFLKARRKLFELKDPVVRVEPRRARARSPPANARGRGPRKTELNAEEKEFQRWLSTLDTDGIENKDTNEKLLVVGKPRKSVDVIDKNTDAKAPEQPNKATKKRKTPLKKQQKEQEEEEQDSTNAKPKPPTPAGAACAVPKPPTSAGVACAVPKPPTSAGAACAVPKPVTNVPSRLDNIVNRNIVFNGMSSTTNRLKWNSADDERFTVDLDKKTTDEMNAVDKLFQLLLDIAKNASFPKDAKFRVVISWGELYIKLPKTMEDSKPKNIKELTELIRENMDVNLSFDETDIEGIADKNKPSNTSPAEYVVVCENPDRSSSSDKIALIYNDKKKLKKLSTFSTCWICGVRRDEELVDSLYQIYSKNDEIDPKNDQFSFHLNLIFNNAESTSILSGTSPRLTIATDLFKPNIRVVSLRRVIRCEYSNLHIRAFGRCQFDTLKDLDYGFSHVTYIATEKINGKIQTNETVEFYAEPIQIAKKHEKDLKQLFSSAEEFFD